MARADQTPMARAVTSLNTALKYIREDPCDSIVTQKELLALVERARAWAEEALYLNRNPERDDLTI